MSESIYRKPFNPKALGVLQDRSRQLKSPQQYAGGSTSTANNPAYATIKGISIKCNSKTNKTEEVTTYLNKASDSIVKTYYSKDNIKTFPILENLTYTIGSGDYYLGRKLNATIKCFTKYQFQDLQDVFCIPGNIIEATYGRPITWGDTQFGSTGRFRIATFSFSANSDNTWSIEFTAVAMASSLSNIDVMGIPVNDGDAIKFLDGKSVAHPVKGIAQLIASDAQKNGQFSIDDIKDGDVISSFNDFKRGGDAAIVIYNGDHIKKTGSGVTGVGFIDSWVNKKTEAEVQDEVATANNQVYATLGYVVNRMVNDQLFRKLAKTVVPEQDRIDFETMNILIPKKYKKIRIPDIITSGDPTSVLILGLGKGNYLNSKSAGKNFEKVNSLDRVKAYEGGGILNIENILVHRDVIANALSSATKTQESNSDWASPKNTKEEVINVMDFFRNLFDAISSCLGNAVSLRVIESPDNEKELWIVDQNYSGDENFKIAVFDPVDEDGSTLSCEVQSNVGSQEYRTYMFVGPSKNADALVALKDCQTDIIDVRQKEYDAAIKSFNEVVKNPGNLGENNFQATEINALKSIMVSLYHNYPQTNQYQNLHFPGMKMSITIKGTDGIIPCMGMWTTQLPLSWLEKKAFFLILSVVHTIADNDWTTQLEGILTYDNKIEPVYL